jgi:GDP-mannose 6-dehydrogenase
MGIGSAERKMDITVFGLGYVGCVTLGCLAEQGHRVVGVDVNPEKVGLIREGKPTIVEAEIAGLIRAGCERGAIRATGDPLDAVRGTEVSFVCVGTPPTRQGRLDMSHLLGVAAEIGRGLRGGARFHTVVLRSTMMPGTAVQVGEILARESGLVEGEGFAVVANPEFLREGTAVNDYRNPPMTVVGTNSQRAREVMKTVYDGLPAPLEFVDLGTAEMIKFVNNAYHALKISFANEVGSISKALGVNSHDLMALFCRDTKLNISTAYFRPGFAYGGSCLPKDLGALGAMAREAGLAVPVLDGVHPSNEAHKGRAFDILARWGLRRVAVWGLSFKEGTDDLRFSPIVDVVKRLIGEGYRVRVYDPAVNLAFLMGTNRQFLQENLPHFPELLVHSVQELLQDCDVLVANSSSPALLDAVRAMPGLAVLDLQHIPELGRDRALYEGLTWP